jgi:hypothetical protein
MTIAADRICLGTMRLADAECSVREWADFLVAAHRLGVRALHVSHEYDTWPLVRQIAAELANRPDRPTFRYVAKIAEPHFDERSFDPARLAAIIAEVSAGLGSACLHDVQWMWRGDLKDEAARLTQFRAQTRDLEAEIAALKRGGVIERFMCFPYTTEFAAAALELPGIDGLVVYRNQAERDYDAMLDVCAASCRTAHVIRPFFGGQTLISAQLSARDQLAAALDHPAIDYGILSTSRLDHLQQLIG